MRFTLVLLAALALAAPAGSRRATAPPAELFVSPSDTAPGAAAETDVDLSLPASSALRVAAVTVYVPAGYGVDLAAPPGTAIGSATIFLAGRAVPSAAGLFTADAAGPATDTCAPGTHAAVWTAALGELPLTILVDPTPADESVRGAYRLVYCLPSTPTRIVDVDLDLRRVLSNPAASGVLTWRALVTPVAGVAFEVRSLVPLQTVTLVPSFDGRANALALRGRLVAAGQPRPRVNVHLAVATRADLGDARDLGVARTRPDGSYSLASRFARKPTTQRLILAAYVNFYVGACMDPPLLPGGCAEQSIAPPPARLVSLLVPRRLTSLPWRSFQAGCRRTPGAKESWRCGTARDQAGCRPDDRPCRRPERRASAARLLPGHGEGGTRRVRPHR